MTFADDWAAAGNEVEVPPGNYDVEVIDAGAYQRKSDGAPFGKVVFQVRSGQYQGQSYDQILNLGNPVGRAVAKEMVAMLGLDPSVRRELEELGEAMRRDLVGVTANVSLAERNGFRETRVNASQRPLDGFPSYDERRRHEAF